MNKSDEKSIHPKNVGWLEYKLTSQEMDYVWRCIENKKEKWNTHLAGNISSSHLLMDRGNWFWLNTLKPLCKKYIEEFYDVGLKIPTNQMHPYYLKEWWVNYQRQGEFNPLHDHTGVYSFVIWMKIPFDYREQNKKKFAAHSNNPVISAFQFQYNNLFGQSEFYNYCLSSEDEGSMLFFPAQLDHQVYPFYDCEEDRISVSGNVLINTMKLL